MSFSPVKFFKTYSLFCFATGTLLLSGCNQLATPKVSNGAYTFAVASYSAEFTPDGEFSIDFATRAPEVRGIGRTVTATEGLSVEFVFSSGQISRCKGVKVTGLKLSCTIPTDAPTSGEFTVNILANTRPLILRQGNEELKWNLKHRKKSTGPRLLPPLKPESFFISSVVKKGTTAASAKAGDTLEITGVGFLQFGPIQFYLGSKPGDVAHPCSPKVQTDTRATCDIPSGTAPGNFVYWGELLKTPQVQTRTHGSIAVTL